MQSHCNSEQFEFEGFGRHKVMAGFDGGAVASRPDELCSNDAGRDRHTETCHYIAPGRSILHAFSDPGQH